MNEQYPRSSPSLHDQKPRRYPRRQSRYQRTSKDYQFRIENPFRLGEQENMIPQHLHHQISQQEYITQKSIKNIELPPCRRTSNFQKNLKMMQEIAKKQQLKYLGIVDEQQRMGSFEELPPMKINEQDQISLQLNGFYDYKERIEDDFDIFNHDMEDEDVHFYSNEQIPPTNKLDEEVDSYLN